MNNMILAIDIGSTKIAAALATVEKGKPRVIAYSAYRGRTSGQTDLGIDKNGVSNMHLLTDSIGNCLDDLRRISDVSNLGKAIISISANGAHVSSSEGVVNVSNSEITMEKEIKRVLETALTNTTPPIPTDHEVIHILPTSFKVDGREVEDPSGMLGSRLEANVNTIHLSKNLVTNLKRAVNQAGAEVDSIVLAPYAATIATLTSDEKNVGSALILLGGSTSDLIVYINNKIRLLDSIPVGSYNVTSDIAHAANSCSISLAEQIKTEHANLNPIDDEYNLEVAQADGSVVNISIAKVNEAATARYLEIIELLERKIYTSGLRDYANFFVLTGGGAKLNGSLFITKEVLNRNVRISKGINIESVSKEMLDESNTVLTGLLLYGAGHHTHYEIDSNKVIRSQAHSRQRKNYTTEDLDNIVDGNLADIVNIQTLKSSKSKPDIIQPEQSWIKKALNYVINAIKF